MHARVTHASCPQRVLCVWSFIVQPLILEKMSNLIKLLSQGPDVETKEKETRIALPVSK